MSDRAPNMKGELQAATNANPGLFEHAHREGDPQKYDWIKMAAWWLHSKVDQRFGLNMKRDNDGQGLSMDIITFRVGPTDRHVQVFDVCGRCGAPDQTVEWNDITDWSTLGNPGTARWVKPEPFGGSASTPGPAPTSEFWTAQHDAIRTRMGGRPAREVAEQLAYTFPDEQWGEKRTSGGKWSNDTVGRLVFGRLWAVKLSPFTIYGFLDSSHIHNQVQGVNHLGDVAPPAPEPPAEPVPEPPRPEPTPQPPVPVVDIFAVVVRLDSIETAIRAQEALLVGLHADMARELESVKAQLKKGFAITLYGRKVGDVSPKE